MTKLLAEFVASIGVLLLLSAFTLNLMGKLRRTEVTYQSLNLVGAGLSAFAAQLIGFVPFVVLEGCWAIIAAIAIVRSVTSRSGPPDALQAPSSRPHKE